MNSAKANRSLLLAALTLFWCMSLFCAEYVADYILGKGDRNDFLERFSKVSSPGFDPDLDVQRLGVANQTTMLKSETEEIGRLFERTMLQKYGPNYLKGRAHFFSYNIERTTVFHI